MRSHRSVCTAGLAAALIVIMVVPGAAQAPLAARPTSAVGATAVERVELLVGRSTVLRTSRPIKRVSLPKPEVADALVTSSNEVLVHGKMPGTISLLVWGDNGDIFTYDVAVRRDLSELEQRVRQLFPGEPIIVSSNGADVVLSGVVSSKYVVDKASSLAAGYVEKADNVVNLLRQQEGVASNQVLLRVRFAEVSRSALQELGVSFFTSPTGVENTLGRISTQQFSAPGFDKLEFTKESSNFGAPVTSAKGEFTFSDFLNLFVFSERYDIGAVVRALSSRGLFQSLAEPNLVTQNGKEASFLAGGEYPYPVVQGSGSNTAVTIQFKEFGIRLRFTPTMVGSDLINLKIAPEVSSLDFGNAVTLQGFRVPALTSRRTETEVELRDGQTFAVAGLIDNSLTQTMSKIPGLGDIPVLGYLFRSKAYQKNSTELVVMITPQIVRRDSTGVTPNLPRLAEPFLGPLGKGIEPPPPAFTTPPSSAQVKPAQAVPAQAVAPQAVPAQAAPAQAVPVPVAPAQPSDPATMPRPGQVTAAPIAPDVDPNADAQGRRETEQRQRDEEKRAREEAKRAREAAAQEAKRQAEELKRQQAEQKKVDAARKKLAEQEQKKAAAEQKKAAEEQKRLAEEQKKAAEQQKKDESGDALTVAAADDVVVTPVRVRNLEEQRAEAERRKAEQKKAQQRDAKRRALSDPYPPLRSRRNW